MRKKPAKAQGQVRVPKGGEKPHDLKFLKPHKSSKNSDREQTAGKTKKEQQPASNFKINSNCSAGQPAKQSGSRLPLPHRSEQTVDKLPCIHKTKKKVFVKTIEKKETKTEKKASLFPIDPSYQTSKMLQSQKAKNTLAIIELNKAEIFETIHNKQKEQENKETTNVAKKSFTISKLDSKNLLQGSKSVANRIEGPTNEEKARERQLVQKYIYICDLIGHVYADLERVFHRLGFDLSKEYHQYSMDHDDLPLSMLLDNIAGYLRSLQIYLDMGRGKLTLPKDQQLIELFTRLFRDQQGKNGFQQNPLAKEVVGHTLKCIASGIVTPLPEDTEYKVLDMDGEATNLVDEVRTNQKRLLQLNSNAQQLAARVSRKLEEWRDVPLHMITLSKKPQL